MKTRRLAIGLAGSLILCSSVPSWADPGGPQQPADSQWQQTQGQSPVGSFTQADQIILNQVATQGRLDQLCRNLQLTANIGQSLPSSDGSVRLGVLRRLVTLPSVENPQNLELYQVDEYSPELSLTPSFELAERTDESFGLGIGASFSMDSTVVRPRAFFKNCAEVKALLDVADVKLVLPLSLLKHPKGATKEEFVSVMAPRIAAMEDGELWSLSGVTTISAAPSASFTTGHISAGVSIGGTQNGNAVMIVHRLSRTRTRFSLRVSHLRVFNAQGTVADVPIISIFNPAGALTLKTELEKVFNSYVAGQLVDYFTASFSALQQIGNQSTQQYLIVFDMDTTDPAQAAELAGMMQSDFVTLLRRAVSMATLHATQKTTLENFSKLTTEQQEASDRVASIVQTDVGVIDRDHSVTLKLPILGSHTRSSSSSKDDVVTVTPSPTEGTASRELHLATADRPMSDTGFSIPVINKTLVSDNSDTKYTGFYFADDGKLQIVFSHIAAFQRRSAGSVQDTLNEFRDMLSIVGSRGNPAADAAAGQYQVDLPPHKRTIKSGSLSFTLNIDAAGVDKAFHASVDEIRAAAERVFPIGDSSLSESGRDQRNHYNEWMVTRITNVLVQGRDQTPAQRSAALRDLMVKESNSNVVIDSLGSFFSFLPLPKPSEVAYEGTMKVLLQLADRQDVSANLTFNLDAGVPHQKSPGVNLSVNQNASNTDLLDAGRANRERTLQPKYMDVNQ